MRLLHIFAGNLYGGVERLLQTLAACKSQCPEMDPHFAYCFEGQLSRDLRAGGESIHSLGEVRARLPLSVWRARKKLRSLLASGRFDRVVCHSPWLQAIFGAEIRRAGIPGALWLHEAPDGKHWVQRWAKMARPDFVVCNSRFTQSKLSNLYRDLSSAVVYLPVLPPAIQHSDADRAELRHELNTPSDAIVIIQVSRMEDWKGHRILLECLAQMADLPRWLCWVVGGAQCPKEERYFQSLQKLAARSGIAKRVRFLGQRSDVPRFLHAADIFVQANERPEPFGVSFIEALYAGLPVVTTDFGGAKEIVNSSCGILLSPGDSAALQDALNKLIRSEELRKTLSKGGPIHAQGLTEPIGRLKELCRILASTSEAFQKPGATLN